MQSGRGLTDLNSLGPIQPRSFESKELWVPVLVVEPVVFSFFCLKNSGSQTSAFIWTHLRVLNHRCPVSDSIHLVLCISSKPLLLLWKAKAGNHLLSALSTTNLNWPLGRQLGVRLLTTFQLTLPSFIIPTIGFYTIEDNECMHSKERWD